MEPYRLKRKMILKACCSSTKRKTTGEYIDEAVLDIEALFDGTWQRRGYSLLNGVVFAIAKDVGQCIDYRVMSKNVQLANLGNLRKILRNTTDLLLTIIAALIMRDLLDRWRQLEFYIVFNSL